MLTNDILFGMNVFTLAGFVVAAPKQQNETRRAILPTEDETPNPSFERFTIGNLQEAHPF